MYAENVRCYLFQENYGLETTFLVLISSKTKYSTLRFEISESNPNKLKFSLKNPE